jgi:hypothetical protein
MAGILRTDTIQNSNTSTIITQTNSTTITIGTTGQTVALASGASSSGFGATYNGAVNWNTTPITSSPLTAVSGIGYFINTTGGSVTVNLPAGVAGSIVALSDYAGTFGTNAVTVNANGSQKIGGIAAPASLNTQGQSATFVYVDSTQGWINTGDATYITGNSFIVASGGTVSTCGDYKTHIFTGPGTFAVSNTGPGSSTVEYMVVAGGGGGGIYGGGGGAGGYRTNYPTPAGLPVSITNYPITVGAGGVSCQPETQSGTRGGDSIFSTITSTGGGGGSGYSMPNASPPTPSNFNGGSGGGGATDTPTTGLPVRGGGSGNTPPVSPPQGNPGGSGYYVPRRSGGGGGGAGVAGTNGNPNGPAGPGGNGLPIAPAFFGSTAPSYGTAGPAPGRWFAGGGGGYLQAISAPQFVPGSTGGAGGGGDGGILSNPSYPGTAGVANTGGGGTAFLTGGSGIIAIRYKYK